MFGLFKRNPLSNHKKDDFVSPIRLVGYAGYDRSKKVIFRDNHGNLFEDYLRSKYDISESCKIDVSLQSFVEASDLNWQEGNFMLCPWSKYIIQKVDGTYAVGRCSDIQPYHWVGSRAASLSFPGFKILWKKWFR